MTPYARKRFGQNFLHDAQVIARIVQTISPQRDQRLVEIGPGRGAITLPLLEACGSLDVIELDRDLIAPLSARARGHGELIIHQQDALTFDFSAMAPQGDLRVVGNLPYNISTPLLFHLMTHKNALKDMHFMLQKEVVERLGASPGVRAYGRLSVMMQYHCRIDALFDVPPGAFTPAPKVDSAFVRLQPWREAPVKLNSIEALSDIVRQAFSQRRKTLRNTLRNYLDASRMEALGIDPARRPETLNLGEFAALANAARTRGDTVAGND